MEKLRKGIRELLDALPLERVGDVVVVDTGGGEALEDRSASSIPLRSVGATRP